ncbi:MAG TPA: hypothetical protein VJ821_12720 [Anaerolineales bacterium]|nr:hypothetical protein [Anaerolineales bacterium]
MKSERGQSAVLAGLLLIFVLGIAFFALSSALPGMKQGADTIAEELVDINMVVSAHVNNQRIYPNKHAKESHGEYEATLATNCYNDHGVFFIQANKKGDWYFHCMEEDNKTVRTTYWVKEGNKFHMQSAYTKGDGAWSWTQIKTFFEQKWGATRATFPSDGVLYIDSVPAPYLP